MNKLLEKAREYLNKVMTTAITMKTPLLQLVGAYLLSVFCIMLIWTAAWLWQTIHTGVPNLDILLRFLDVLIGPAMIGFVTFIGGCLIDSNGNGIPDKLEGETHK